MTAIESLHLTQPLLKEHTVGSCYNRRQSIVHLLVCVPHMPNNALAAALPLQLLLLLLLLGVPFT
jgi:hypothetical protein